MNNNVAKYKSYSVINESNEEKIIPKVIKIGSRKSKLAIIQSKTVIDLLSKFYKSEYKFELVTYTTKGDQILDVPLSEIGSKALFTKELEVALLNNEIDLIVHSCKDLPTTLPDGLCISAILKRTDPNDVLVLKKSLANKYPKNKDNFIENSFELFDENFTIGTSSFRRIAQIKNKNSLIDIKDIRGNIDTRLRKLDESNENYSALILAGAGLKRAGYSNRISKILDKNWWYAVGQGALAIESRDNDDFIKNTLYPLIDYQTTFQVIAERSFMQYLEGGCSIPLGVRCFFDNKKSKKKLRKKSSKNNRNSNNSSNLNNFNNFNNSINLNNSNNLNGCFKSNFDLNDISNLTLSGVVFSLNGEKKIFFKSNVAEASNLVEDEICLKFTQIVLPTKDCKRIDQVKKDYIKCSKLGIYVAKNIEKLGAKDILDKIKINTNSISN